jgi:hypothetical protein
VIIENKKKKEMNWKKNVNLGRDGNKVEKTMNKMNMNKTRGWTKQKKKRLKEEYEHGGWWWETKKKNED